MSRRLYECTTCGDQHAAVWQAAICCDPASYNPDDEDPTEETP